MKNKTKTIVSGIYKITNVVNGKFYIGSSINIENRWYVHKRELNNNKHQPLLQRAWNKYGEKSFIWHILEVVCLSDIESKSIAKKILIDKEQKYLNTLLFANEKNNKFNKLGYNIYRVADSPIGHIVSKKTKNKISKKRIESGVAKGYNNSMYSSSNYEFWLKNYGEEEANKRLIEANNKKSIASFGKNNPMYGTKRPDVAIKSKKVNSKPILQFDLNRNLLKEWSSMTEAAETLGLNKQSIANYIYKKDGYACGFFWEKKLVNDNLYCQYIAQYDLNNCLIGIYKTIAEAAKITNLSRNGIWKCIHKKALTYKKYKWKSISKDIYEKLK